MNLKKILRKLYKTLCKPVFYLKLKNKVDLLICDTIYPNPISGFRVAEFNEYLQYYDRSRIIVSGKGYPIINQTKRDFKNDLKDLSVKIPEIFPKVILEKVFNNINCKVFYCVFYTNILRRIDDLNFYRIPFAFTLYPGGGFNLKSEVVRDNLRKVCSSPWFRRVIVTQLITKEYLLSNNICKEEQIDYIFGGIVPQNSISSHRENYFMDDKETLDICFCAAKYMDGGYDKGFDIFVEVAQILALKYKNVKFHVIGGFDREELPLKNATEFFIFYGYKKFDELKDIFLKMDIILSPNRPNTLGDGLFDGFPLGAVVEAALNGVIPIVTDELHQNDSFIDEIVICEPKAESFVQEVEKLIQGKDFKNISTKVQSKFREVYSNENQLNKRILIIDDLINS